MKKELTQTEKEFIEKYPTTNTNELMLTLGLTRSLVSSYIIRFKLKKDKLYKRKGDPELTEVFNDQMKLGYFSGLIASDGSISSKEPNRVILRLKIDDMDVVKSMSTTFLGKDKTKIYQNGKNLCALFGASLPVFSEHLRSIGVVPRKTYEMTLMLPTDRRYRLGFLRGFIDGDGYIDEKRGRVEIVSYLKTPLVALLEITQSGKLYPHSNKYHKLTVKASYLLDLPAESYMMHRKNTAIEQLISNHTT